MWEDQGEDEVEDDDDEDEGLAGQLLSDLIAANKYGTSISSLDFILISSKSSSLSLSVFTTERCFTSANKMLFL